MRAYKILFAASLLAVVAWAVGVTTTYAAAPAPFKVGDHVFVAMEGAPLMDGPKVVARISRGFEASLIAISGPWVGTQVNVGGKNVTGWILASEVASTRDEANRAVYRSYSYEPTPMARSYTPSYGGYRSGRGSNRSNTPFWALPKTLRK